MSSLRSLRLPVLLASFLLHALACGAALAGGTAPQRPDLLVVLVRHAETEEDGGRDRGLSAAGRSRAAALAAALESSRLVQVVTSRFRRTRETAAPAAERFGLEVVAVPVGSGGLEAHARAVADAVRAAPPGGTVLVVGHSNTVPAIIAALGGPELAELDESDHASLFTLSLGASDTPRLVRTRYGD